MHSPVESVMIPVALSLLPTVIAGPSVDDTLSVKLNFSSPSAMLSFINAILTLLIFMPLATVAITVVVMKSTPPVKYSLAYTYS